MNQKKFFLINVIERALSDLLRGLPIIFNDDKKNYLVFSAELFSENVFHSILNKKNQFYNLIITQKKAERLGFHCHNNASISILSSNIVDILDLNKLNNDHCFSKIDSDVSKYGIILMKKLRLLPYLIVEEINEIKITALPINLQTLSSDLVDQYFSIQNHQSSIQEISRSNIALKNAENSEIIVFRDVPNFGTVHVMILIGEQNSEIIPNVRIHSGCYTGDLLASLQCDCRDQLQETIKYLNKMWVENRVYGAIIYQAIDEGRAIGLINKIRTYNLQRCSCNTIEANHEIGYKDDERDFISAANILKKMKIMQCRLITNNPKKIISLEQQNIKIIERVSLITKSNKYNEEYLNIKFNEMNHIN